MFNSDQKRGSWPSYVLNILIPLCLGIIAFFVIAGPLPLDPTNIDWLKGNTDPTQHYLGWAFYLNSPWRWPLGLNPQYGLDISSSIVYSDAIPLLAITFKALSGWLTTPFQYFGWWLLTCFILQAWFAWKLLSLITDSVFIKSVAVLLFLFCPILLFRVGLHAALVGQFVLLAALYLNLRSSPDEKGKPGQSGYWALLLTCTVLIHFYLFVMVFALWVCDWITRYSRFLQNQKPHKALWGEALINLACIGLAAWQAGYFVISTSAAGAEGYGLYRLTLQSLFDSNGWSYFLPEITNGFDAGEGFAYLGAGTLLLCLFALVSLLISKNAPALRSDLRTAIARYPLLLLLLLVFTLFALSNQISFGAWVVSYPLPDSILKMASALRSSGRVFWPVYYALLLLIIFIIVKAYSQPKAFLILLVCASLQIIDTSAGWNPIANYLRVAAKTPTQSPLQHPFWGQAATCFDKVLRVPIGNSLADWSVFASYAAAHDMGTNSVFLSRVEGKIPSANQALLDSLTKHQWDPKAIYILGDQEVLPIINTLSTEEKNQTALMRIDGYNVFLVKPQACSNLALPTENLITEASMRPQLGEIIGLTKTSQYTNQYLVRGWAFPEGWGTWSDSAQATITLPMPQAPAKTLTLNARAFIAPKHPTQRVVVTFNGQTGSHQTFALTEESNQIRIPLPVNAISTLGQKTITITLGFPDKITPKSLGLGDDIRQLAIGIESARFD
jgi:hypothetical protein